MVFRERPSLSVRQAAVIQFASRYSSYAVQFIITMVLARLITPAEFGVVAVIAVFTAFFSLISDMGVSSGIVQHKDLTDQDISGLLLGSVYVGAGLTVLFCLITPAIAALYDMPELIPLGCFASLGLLLNTLSAVPNGVLLRDKRFLANGVLRLSANLVAGAVAIALALTGAGCYALVLQTVLSALVMLVGGLRLSHVRVQRAPVWAPVKKILSFSAFQFLHRLVNYFSLHLDNLLVGALFGGAALGYYDKAYKLAKYPNMGLTSIIASVLHPFLSHYQDQPQEIYVRFVKVLKGVACVSVLASMVLFVFSEEAVLIMYGEQWSASVPLLRMLSLSIMFQMCTALTGAIFQSLGKTNWMFVTAVINTSITVVAILVGCWAHDLELLALLVCLAYVVNPVATFGILIAKGFCLPVRTFMKEMAPNLLMAAVVAAVSVVLVYGGEFSLPVKALVCLVVYGGLLFATGEWRSLKTLVK